MKPLLIKINLQQAENLQAVLIPFLMHVKSKPLHKTKLDLFMAIDLLESLYKKLNTRVFNRAEVINLKLRICEQIALHKLIPLIKAEQSFHILDITVLDDIYNAIDKIIINI